jgi:hypothetical protein
MNAASDKQIAYVKRLVGQKQLRGEDADRLWTLLEAHEIDVRTPGDGSRIGSKVASQVIDWLQAQPWKPRENERQDGQPAGLGVYQRDGRIFVVREFTPDGESRKVRFAREIVTLRDAQGDRLDNDGQHVRYEEIKAPRMQWELKDEELVPMEELSRLGVQFGHCIVCGTKLEVADSVERGIGPVCAKRQQARLTQVA